MGLLQNLKEKKKIKNYKKNVNWTFLGEPKPGLFSISSIKILAQAWLIWVCSSSSANLTPYKQITAIDYLADIPMNVSVMHLFEYNQCHLLMKGKNNCQIKPNENVLIQRKKKQVKQSSPMMN